VTAEVGDRRSARLLATAVLAAFVLLALQSGAIMTVLALALDDLGFSTDVGSTMAFFLAANLIGMSAGGLLCRWLPPGLVVLTCMLIGAGGLGVGAAAPDLVVFLVGRSLQGMGNGACMVALYVIAAAGFEGVARGRLLRGISTAWMLPTIAGPALAGAVAEQLGWRAVFGAGAAGLVGAGLLVVAASGGLRGVRSQVLPRVVAAAGVAAAGVCGLQLLPAGPIALSIAVGFALALLVVSGAHVMLPPQTLALGRGAPSGIALRGLLAGAFFGVEAWVPLLLIEQGRLSADRAGLLIGVGGICWVVGAWSNGARRTDALAPHRVGGLVGACVVIAVGMAGLAISAASSASPAFVGVAWSVACFGMGAALPVISILVFDQTSAGEYAVASVGLQSSDALGCAAVVAVCGLLFAVVHPIAAEAAYAAVFGLGGLVAVVAVFAAPRLAPRSVLAGTS
jgi:MFS family permease